MPNSSKQLRWWNLEIMTTWPRTTGFWSGFHADGDDSAVILACRSNVMFDLWRNLFVFALETYLIPGFTSQSMLQEFKKEIETQIPVMWEVK